MNPITEMMIGVAANAIEYLIGDALSGEVFLSIANPQARKRTEGIDKNIEDPTTIEGINQGFSPRLRTS